jgi:hypothetical protein
MDSIPHRQTPNGDASGRLYEAVAPDYSGSAPVSEYLRPIVLAYMAATSTTASALGRAACGDQNVVYRLRDGDRISDNKRAQIWTYMRNNPKGPPKKTRHRHAGARWEPNRTNRFEGGESPHYNKEDKLSTPVPALSELEDGEQSWVRTEAFKRGIALPRLLSELVSLGILCYLENQKEES